MKLTRLFISVPLVLGLNMMPINTEKADAQVTCGVTGIQTGQLALRFSPGGRSRAGLNNGEQVTILKYGRSPWVYVVVGSGRARGLKGWVNGNYLACDL